MDQVPQSDFKPNIYPVMYWALAYGAAAAILLFVVFLLSRFITIIWFPVFAVGLVVGGYRNYRKQKQDWQISAGQAPTPGSPVDEFKQAARDLAAASSELLNQDTSEASPTEPTPADDTQNQPPAPPA